VSKLDYVHPPPGDVNQMASLEDRHDLPAMSKTLS